MRRRAIGWAAAAAVALAAALAYAGAERAAPARVVAIGDIHCEYDGLVSILREAGLTDAQLKWTGGTTVAVQTGDILDRGAECRRVLDLLRDLERQAQRAGGALRVLLGNHEGFHLAHEFRDVSPEAFAKFADGRSEKRRERAYDEWAAHQRARAKARGQEVPPPAESDGAERAQWMAAHPPGWLEYQEAFGARGDYGRWLRRLPAVARIGDTLFLHGGIAPALQPLSVEQLNSRVEQEIAALDEARAVLTERGWIVPSFTLAEMLSAAAEARAALPQASALESAADATLRRVLTTLDGIGGWYLFHGDGPLWFRGYARWSEAEGEPLAAALTAAYGVEHLVVGHTAPPTDPGRIAARFGGRILLIDTGMLPGHYPGGRPSALEIAGGRFIAIYSGERVVLLEPRARAAALGTSLRRPAALPGVVHASFRAAAQAPAPQPAPADTRRIWLARDGTSLPFDSDEEALEFLSTAKVVDQEAIPVGITRPRRVVLEKDGVTARAIFRYVHQDEKNVRLAGGTFVPHLLDSYKCEVAAYELARILDLTNLPPAVERRLGTQRGSMQLWIEKASNEKERMQKGVKPPDAGSWSRQLYDMFVFDQLIGNIDRNQGNFLADANWRLWMVDHTRTFSRDARLPNPERVTHCSRPLWTALRALEPATVKARLSPYIGRFEQEAMFKRRAKVVELLEKRIAERGEKRVIFDYAGPPPEAPTALPPS